MSETLWDGGPILEQASGVFPMGTDSILLADFARPGKRDRILDLGTGSGILPVLLLSRQAQCTALALEIDPAACDLARRNLAQNQLSQRGSVLEGDLRDHRQLLKAGGFDLTVSNPPYFSRHSGPPAGNGLRDARGEHCCTLSQLCQAAAWATRWGGRFCLVFRPERLAELICALRENSLEPKRLRPVHHARSSPVNLVLLEARRGGNPGLTWEDDLYLYHPDGTETPELRRIYHRL
jgi:tRNA1(Val) A37 N6-methylase TrmN6